MHQPAFSIDPSEEFETLAHPPIVEAALQWRAVAPHSLNPEDLLQRLKGHLTDYEGPQRRRRVELSVSVSADDSTEQESKATWEGFRYVSKDETRVAQFYRDRFAFNRINGYDGWGALQAEGCRLWNLYQDAAQPEEISRLRVRFLNQIPVTDANELHQLMTAAPQSPEGMPILIDGFLHRTDFAIPGYAYGLKVTCTIQQPILAEPGSQALILELDTFTTRPLRADDPSIEEHLRNMRWIKNKAFHSLLTAEAIDRFRE